MKALAAPGEALTPGLLYVGVAALSGSILARSRGRFLRFSLPPTLFVLSFNHFLPKTAHNVREYGAELEERYFPTLAEKHAIGQAHASMAWERIKESWHGGVESTGAGVSRVVQAIEETTGLKLSEVLGTGRTMIQRAETEVSDTIHDISHKAQERVEDVKSDVQTEVPVPATESKTDIEGSKRLV